MTDSHLNFHAPSIGGNLYLEYRKCPKCESMIQITIQNVCDHGTRFEVVCSSCGNSSSGLLSSEERQLINPKL